MAYIDYYFKLFSVKTNCLKSMAILDMENAHYKLKNFVHLYNFKEGFQVQT